MLIHFPKILNKCLSDFYRCISRWGRMIPSVSKEKALTFTLHCEDGLFSLSFSLKDVRTRDGSEPGSSPGQKVDWVFPFQYWHGGFQEARLFSEFLRKHCLHVKGCTKVTFVLFASFLSFTFKKKYLTHTRKVVTALNSLFNCNCFTSTTWDEITC